jgi:hypothetical protein
MNAYILILIATANSIAIAGNTRPIETKWPVVTMQRFDDKQACENALQKIRFMLPISEIKVSMDCVPANSAVAPPTRDK